MNAYLFFDPRARPLSVGGDIMPGAKLKFFVSTTLTPAAVYADAALTTPLGVEVIADADGQFVPIYMDPKVLYRVQIYDANDVLQPNGDIDPFAPQRDSVEGDVVMFFGSAAARDAAYPPALWQVCDGTNGSPDLRDRVPLGAGGAFSEGDTGGALSGNTGLAGGHNHGGSVSAVALDASQMPLHNHRLYVRTSATLKGNTRGFGFANTAGVEGQDIADAPFGYLDTAPSSGGNTLVEATGTLTPGTHTHTIAAVADHQHSVNTTPPFLALWFLYRRA